MVTTTPAQPRTRTTAATPAPAVPGFVRRLAPGQVAADGSLAFLAFLLCGLAVADARAGFLAGWLPTALFTAAVAVRRACPWVMIGLAAVAGTVQLVYASANAGSVVVMALLFATAGFDRDRWVRRVGLVAVAVAAVGGGVAAGTHGFFTEAQRPSARTGLVTGGQIAFVAGAAWLVGFVRHQRRLTAEARVAEQIARVEERRVADLLAHEQERNRIARDMHDVVAHTLAVVIAQAEGARYAMAQRPEVVERALRTIAETGRESLGDIRRLLSELRGEPADETGDTPIEDALFDRMRHAGLALDVCDVGQRRVLAPPQAAAARWILTEALTNALRHGVPGTPVTLHRTWGADLEVTVSNVVPDDAPHSPGAEPRHGLLGVAERIRLAGGQAAYGIEQVTGRPCFVLRVRLPYQAPAAPPGGRSAQ